LAGPAEAADEGGDPGRDRLRVQSSEIVGESTLRAPKEGILVDRESARSTVAASRRWCAASW
jgi:hypothetical protein